MAKAKRKARLGEALIEKGVITHDQLNIALTEQKDRNEPLGKILVGLGFATESIMHAALGETLEQEIVDLKHVIPDTEALKLVDDETARKNKVLPLTYDEEEQVLSLAMSDTFNLFTLDRIRVHVGTEIEVQAVLAGETEIANALDQFYGYELSIDGILREIETGEVDFSSFIGEGEEYSQPLVRLVDVMLADAVKRGASDIHFEPEESFLRIRYRIDGVLRQIRSLHKTYWSAIVVRLKVMANLNIAESRAPQDGRISRTITGRVIDFRVSSQPTMHGENIVLRVLDREKGIVPLEKLGLEDDMLAAIKMMMARPEGIILVTGPTGSGKTTTLYSMLNFLSTERVNIMTLEDPVEYPFPMIRQASVNEAAGMGFANGIRAMLRQDPDIILIGEIRDQETAEMAFRAAMTGHQVFSTLHTNSAIGAIPRLLDIGILPDIASGNIIGILAQRLVRKLCVHCKEEYPAEDWERALIGDAATDTNVLLHKAKGCKRCEHQGYKGRMSILEVLSMTPKLDEMVANKRTAPEIKAVAVQDGFKTLADNGIRMVLKGVTSLEEVSRVADLTERLH